MTTSAIPGSATAIWSSSTNSVAHGGAVGVADLRPVECQSDRPVLPAHHHRCRFDRVRRSRGPTIQPTAVVRTCLQCRVGQRLGHQAVGDVRVPGRAGGAAPAPARRPDGRTRFPPAGTASPMYRPGRTPTAPVHPGPRTDRGRSPPDRRTRARRRPPSRRAGRPPTGADAGSDRRLLSPPATTDGPTPARTHPSPVRCPPARPAPPPSIAEISRPIASMLAL